MPPHTTGTSDMPRRNPSRSARSLQPVTTFDEYQWDPKLKNPESKIDQQIHVLNHDAFLADTFARTDDMLVFSLFANKGKRRHHEVKPEPAQESMSSPISREDGKAAANVCRPLLNGTVPCDDLLDNVKGAVTRLQNDIPAFKLDKERWGDCLEQ
jgi:hypothetical protein